MATYEYDTTCQVCGADMHLTAVLDEAEAETWIQNMLDAGCTCNDCMEQQIEDQNQADQQAKRDAIQTRITLFQQSRKIKQ
jgi:hypothetical protein